MSIISEALKKAHETYRKSEKADDKALLPKERVVETAVKPKASRKILFLPIFILTGLVLAGVLYFQKNLPVKEDFVKTLATLPIEEVTPIHEIASTTTESVKPIFEKRIIKAVEPSISFAEVSKAIKLNGIMYTTKNPLAVVNGGIWSPGEEVNGFKIIEIGKDFIKVAWKNGSEFIVRLER